MKKYLSTVIILVLLILISANPVFASSKYGTKAYSMGGAFTAIADDASAVYWNPAGLTQNSLVGIQVSGGGQMDREDIEDIADFIDTVEELSDSSNPTLADLEKIKLPNNTTANVNGIAALNLSKIGVAGVFDSQFTFRGEKKTYIDPDTGDEYSVPEGTANNYLTGQGIVGLGTKIIDPPVLGSLSVGVSGKYLYARHDQAETTYDEIENKVIADYNGGKNDNGIGADIGALATLTDTDVLNIKAGATVKNIVNTMDTEVEALEQKTTIGAGATLKFPLIEAFSARVAADLEMPKNAKNIRRIGAEGTIGVFSVRAGAYESDSIDTVYTGGVGFNLPFIDFNLALDSEDYISASGTFNF